MSIFLLALLGGFTAIECVVEMPKMWKNKEYRDLAAFTVLLFLGITLAVLKILNVKIPNPSDTAAFLFSPAVHLLKGILE